MITQHDIEKLQDMRVKADNFQLDKIIEVFTMEKYRRVKIQRENLIIRKNKQLGLL